MGGWVGVKLDVALINESQQQSDFNLPFFTLVSMPGRENPKDGIENHARLHTPRFEIFTANSVIYYFTQGA